MTPRPPSSAPIDIARRQAPTQGRTRARLFRFDRTLILICVAALLLGVFSAAFLDVPVARMALQSPPSLRAVAQRFSDLGLSNYMLIGSAIVMLAVYLLRRRPAFAQKRAALDLLGERAWFIFATVALSGILVQVLKHLVGRARPKGIATLDAFHFDAFSIKASLASFPSGHSTSIFALAMAVSLIAPRFRVPAFGLAILVALARVVLAAHFVSDIVAGAALGLITTVALAGVFADRAVAFTREDGILVLKGRGLIMAMLRGQAPSAERVV